MKSDELFDSLADRLKGVSEGLTEKTASPPSAVPDLDDIDSLYTSLDKKLTSLDKLGDSDYVIKTANEFYFTGMYFKAAIAGKLSRRDAVLSGLTQADALGGDSSFIRKEYKELKKRLAP